MAKLPGLFQRNGVWTLRVMIPLELQPFYEGRSKLIESLKTGDSAQAKVRGTLRRAELLAEFEQKRRELTPQKVERVPRSAESALDELSGMEIAGGIVVYAPGHRIESTHRPVFKDGRPWYVEYAFSVVDVNPPVHLLTLGLVGSKVYDMAKPREVLVKVNSRGLCERLVGALVERLAVSPVVATKA